MKSKRKKSVKKESVKKGFSLREEYIKSWKYLKEAKRFIFIVIFLFFFSAILGFFVSPPEILSKSIMELLKGLVEKTQGMGGLELIAFIFFNNLQTSFSGMVFGFLFGIFPVITTLINGYLLGFVSSMSVNVDSFASLLKLLPHGIFELPAVFISLGLGLKFGTFMFNKDKSKSFKDFFWNSIRVFLLIVLPLLLIAAIIEGSLIFLLA